MSNLLTVRDILNVDSPVLAPDMPIAMAIDMFVNNSTKGAPVCDATGSLVGFLSAHDIMVEMWCQDYQPDTKVTVQELMKSELVTLDIESPLTDVIELLALDKDQLYPVTEMGYATELSTLSLEQRAKVMKVHKPQILPVLDNGKFAGVISRHEILQSIRTLFPEVPLHRDDVSKENTVSESFPNATV
ncbi:CBS domain-containing protein [Vibrio hannami]|uniref:CBS domain-containing protein n=1 Tax=Vibrio hannami TaxID=2717094 RepID=UPI00240EAC5C|nr:CBS domain-containing protein [Vibrio hannami]MDG3086345.1 CBS domain-containing protein [Vibrio hannami]